MTMVLDAPETGMPSSARMLLVGGCQLVGETLQAALATHGFDVALSVGASGADTLTNPHVLAFHFRCISVNERQLRRSAPSYQNTDAAGTPPYVGAEEGVRANERYSEGSTEF